MCVDLKKFSPHAVNVKSVRPDAGDAEIDLDPIVYASSPAPAELKVSGGSSYRQIFKATSITGGTQVVTIFIGIVRNKAMAVLLGPTGVGLAGTYLTVMGMIGGITQLGLGPSGVRQIAEASGANDQVKLARTVIALRRISLFSGLLGLLAGLVLAYPLSNLTFGGPGHAGDLALLSVTLLVGSIYAGEWALLQGLRRLSDLAKSQIWGTFWGAGGSIVIIIVLREEGIALCLVVNSLLTLWFSRWYAPMVPCQGVILPWVKTWPEARPLLTLGCAFVVQNLVLSAGGYLTRLLIIDQLGLVAVGLFTASWVISTYYVQLILKAIAVDFLPRLTVAAVSSVRLGRMVEEQIQLGVLLAVPGVVGTLSFTPIILKFLYSEGFEEASAIIRWQLLGVLIQVASWPIGIIQVAKQQVRLMLLSEILSVVIGLFLLSILITKNGYAGIGQAFAGTQLLILIYTLLISKIVFNYTMSSALIKNLSIPFCLVAMATLSILLTNGKVNVWLGLALTLISSLLCGLKIMKLLEVSLAKVVIQLLRRLSINLPSSDK